MATDRLINLILLFFSEFYHNGYYFQRKREVPSMQEIKCPNCGQVFQVDESGYAQIVQQIRDREFAQELDRREQELKKRTESDLTVS